MTALESWPSALMNTYGTPAVELSSGEGAHVTDAEGRSYIDMLAGIAVNALGHAHPALIDAVSTQTQTLGHVSNLFASAPTVELAQRLKGQLSRLDEQAGESAKVFFCNSGGEANEAAFKLARLTKRSRVLTAVHGFHGRTMGSLALTGQADKRAPFEPLPAGVEYYPYGDVAALTEMVERNPSDVAAIMLEPIQGETGVVPAPEGFLRAVRELCDRHGILMIVDEVQTGIGRTGEFWAFEHEPGVIPDVITMAKGLGGGLPLGACMATGSAAELFGPGSHGTTFGGNPIVCAAGRAVVDIVADPAFLAEVRDKGQRLADGVDKLALVDHVRGRGLMLGLVLTQPVAKKVVQAGYRHGLILNACGDDVVRLTPPLVITESDIDSAIARFADTCKEVEQ
ncbi:Acetylornithine aminotransferase [Corynebacterium ciconiae DSM 44920]|uniref:acetylornithine transaminase n=1 Tax=Corynebacterium ciconiae TaxID=227319 RepID=UPI00036E649D|nr:acetylornithine transaminase [Corynebacterium ciconiae]WKD61104.1 Acetylornithine aminotransferase [Corynebacterium ciconiae DSM 44920]